MVWGFAAGEEDKLPDCHTALDKEIQLKFQVLQAAECVIPVLFLKIKSIRVLFFKLFFNLIL